MSPGARTTCWIASSVSGAPLVAYRAAARASADRLRQAVRGEDFQQPAVDGRQELFFAHVDVDGVPHVVGEGVFLRVAATVVGALVVVLGLHLAPADAAVDQAAQDVGVDDTQPGLLLAFAAPAAVGADDLGRNWRTGPIARRMSRCPASERAWSAHYDR
jgi:hypothetical protein